MAEKIPLFAHVLPSRRMLFVGTEPEQVCRTIDYYCTRERSKWSDVTVPSPSEVKSQPGLSLTYAFPMPHRGEDIIVRPYDNLSVTVNSNRFERIQDCLHHFERAPRGDLYKLVAGTPLEGTWLLPREIMGRLRDYNWAQHRVQIEAWEKARVLEIIRGWTAS